MQQQVLLSSKFHALALNVTAVFRLDSLACQDEFFVNNFLNVKENDKHALDFALHFPQGGLLLCPRVMIVNSALVATEGCIVGGDLTKLIADVDVLLLLIRCQKSHQAK
jgi:hypothetical protein